ncbi:MAG: thiolase family protein [Nocardioides sp.]
MSSTRVGIVGVGMTPMRARRPDTDLFGLLREAAVGALGDASVTMGDVDLVVLSQGPDALYGIGHPEQELVDVLAARGKRVVRVQTGGTTGTAAVQMAWWAIAAGEAQCALVVGADKMGDTVQPAQYALNLIWDPAYESLLPLNTISMAALQAQRYLHRHGVALPHAEQVWAQVASRLRTNGALNPAAQLRKPVTPEEVLSSPLLFAPIRRDMACPQTSGGAALVMVSAERAATMARPTAWIDGLAACSNTYFLGDKMGAAGTNDHASFLELSKAAAAAYSQAGISDPARQIDVAEPYIPFATMEPIAVEALGFSEPGQGIVDAEKGRFDRGGAIPVCPSGGVLCAAPISISALNRFAEGALQVRGRAGDHQVEGCRTAVVTGAGGSIQFAAVAVLRGGES